MNNGICVLCGYDILESRYDMMTDFVKFKECPTCGSFSIKQDMIEDIIEKMDATEKLKISVITREQEIHNKKPLCISNSEQHLDGYNNKSLDEVKALFPKRIQDRLNRALSNLCKLSQYPGYEISWKYYSDHTILMAESSDSGIFMLKELSNNNFIDVKEVGGGEYRIIVLAKGYELVLESETNLGRMNSRQAFIAMNFHDSLNDICENGIYKAIEDCGFTPFRVDDKETNNNITDEIIAEIKKSRFVVADFTGHRGGVYFEAGYALGHGIPVIWMCSEEDKHDLHFDTRQYSHIFWSDSDELRKKLKNRILATISSIDM